MELLALLLLFLLPFAPDGQYPIVYSNLDILFLDLRNLCLNDKVLIGLSDVYPGSPVPSCNDLLTTGSWIADPALVCGVWFLAAASRSAFSSSAAYLSVSIAPTWPSPVAMKRSGIAIRVKGMVYARHGRELMGCPFDPAQGKESPLCVNPVNG
jgi:hypothetical protein